MKNTKFKVLMHCGMYVNPDLLNNGIYCSPKPFLYDSDTTIESLIEESRDLEGHYFLSKMYFNDTYYDSLKQCELVEVTLNFEK